jgi:hypothetical protein
MSMTQAAGQGVCGGYLSGCMPYRIAKEQKESYQMAL